MVPGGWAPDRLRRSDAVKDLVRKTYHQGKIVGLICHYVGDLERSIAFYRQGDDRPLTRATRRGLWEPGTE